MAKSTKIFLILFSLVGFSAIVMFFIQSRTPHYKHMFNAYSCSSVKNAKHMLDDYFANRGHFPASLRELPFKNNSGVQVDCAITSNKYVCVSAHNEGSREFLACYSSNIIYGREHKRGTPVRASHEWFNAESKSGWKALK